MPDSFDSYNVARSSPSTATHGGVDVMTDDIIVLAIDGNVYDPSIANDEDIADITPGAIIARSAPVTGKTLSPSGAFGFDPIVMGSPAAGSTITRVVLAKEGASDAVSALLLELDPESFTPELPLATTGDALTYTPPASGVYVA